MACKKYRIYCESEPGWKLVWSVNPPTTCPTNAAHTVRANSSYIVNANSGSVNRFYIADPSITNLMAVSIGPDSAAISAGIGYPSKNVLDISSSVTSIVTVGILVTRFVTFWQNAAGALKSVIVDSGVAGPVTDHTSDFGAITVSRVLAIMRLGDSDVAVLVKRSSSSQCYCTSFSLDPVGPVLRRINAASTVLMTSNASISTYYGSCHMLRLSATAGLFAGVYNSSISNSAAMRPFTIESVLTDGGYKRVSLPVVETIQAIPATYNTDFGSTFRPLDATRILFICGAGNMTIFTCSALTLTRGLLYTWTPSGITISDDAQWSSALYDTGRIAVAFSSTANQCSYGYAGVITSASGTVPTRGTPVRYSGDIFGVTHPQVVLTDYPSFRLIIAHLNSALGYRGELTAISCSSSSTVVTVLTDYSVYTNAGYMHDIVKCSAGNCAMVYKDLSYGGVPTFTRTAFDGEKIILDTVKGIAPLGIATEKQSDDSGQSICRVVNKGYVSGISGLTTAYPCYAHGDGSITNSFVATSPQYEPVKIGVCLSSGFVQV